MARESRLVLNRKAFDWIDLANADGLFAVAQKVIEVAHPPDAPPFARGLVEGGGAVAWLGSKKVATTTIGGRQIAKPRGLKVGTGEVAAIAGFGFPGRFVELGTVDTPAEPFLTPAVNAVAPNAEVLISKATKRRLAGFKDARAAARFG